MRVLFYSVKGTGHVNPTLPLVRGLVARGHDVVYTLTIEWRERLEALGCRFRNTGEKDDAPFTTADFNPDQPFYRQLLPATAATLPHLVPQARELDPDAIVFDSCAPWGLAIGKVLGCPAICSVSTLVFDAEEVRRQVGDRTLRTDARQESARAELATRWGISDFADRDIGLFYGDENLVYSCESLNPTHGAVRGRFHFVGTTFPAGDEQEIVRHDLEAFVRRDGRRRVYASIGTVVGGNAGLDPGFFAPFFQALGDRDDTKLLLSIGTKIDPHALGRIPPNVIVRASVPQIAVLEHTDVFVTHAGANSMHEGLFHGVPLVCVPHFGDQPQNAERVAAVGAGVHVPVSELSASRLEAEIARVLGDPSYRNNAARIGQELRSGGGLERAVRIVESAAPASLPPPAKPGGFAGSEDGGGGN